MFEFDPGKLILIGIVALMVLGPRELPRVMLQLGQAAAKMRRMAAEFRAQFMEAMREAEMENIKSEVTKLAGEAKRGATIDPLAQIKAELTSAMAAADEAIATVPAPTPAIAAPVEAAAPGAPRSLPVPLAPESKTPALAEAAREASPQSGDSSRANASEV